MTNSDFLFMFHCYQCLTSILCDVNRQYIMINRYHVHSLYHTFIITVPHLFPLISQNQFQYITSLLSKNYIVSHISLHTPHPHLMASWTTRWQYNKGAVYISIFFLFIFKNTYRNAQQMTAYINFNLEIIEIRNIKHLLYIIRFK